jgi:hypothetical protein
VDVVVVLVLLTDNQTDALKRRGPSVFGEIALNRVTVFEVSAEQIDGRFGVETGGTGHVESVTWYDDERAQAQGAVEALQTFAWVRLINQNAAEWRAAIGVADGSTQHEPPKST